MAPPKKPKGIKAKNMMYAQQLTHLYPDISDRQGKLDRLIERVERLDPKQYALIVHDHDVDPNGKPVEPHVHMMLSFINARSLASVAKQIGDKPQYIEQWTGNANNGYAYLVHRTKDSVTRYQYDPLDVIANFDYPALVTQQIPQEIARAHERHTGDGMRDKLDMLYAGVITKRELEMQLSGSVLARYSRQIDTVWGKRLMRQAEEWREQMRAEGKHVETIWLYGETGTGKTRFAKEFAAKRGQPYFLAGSSKDIFQTYAGQHTLILDELRPDNIPFEDLLRITDPFSICDEVMAPSRYFDKSLACDLVIITTPYNPERFHFAAFAKGKENDAKDKVRAAIDKLDQLHRRISLLMYLTTTEIQALSPVSHTAGNVYIPIPGATRPNPYSQNDSSMVRAPMDIFNELFAAPATEPEEETDGPKPSTDP